MMMMKRTTGLIAASLLVLAACGGGDKPAVKDPGSAKTGPGGGAPADLSKDAQAKFNAAIDVFVEHDKKNDWNDETCKSVAEQFEAVGKNAQALFNSGLAYQRCNDDKNAKAK
jgi:ABC-type glycerol-3-phosphate transport system substrate-binding protein